MSTNLFRRLRDLLPEPPLTVATVAATNADGTVTVTYPGGSQVRARGVGGVGSKVFLRSGIVEGEAPSLPTLVIDV